VACLRMVAGVSPTREFCFFSSLSLLNLQPSPRDYAAPMSRPPILWGMDPIFHVPMQLMIFQINAMTSVPEHEGTLLLLFSFLFCSRNSRARLTPFFLYLRQYVGIYFHHSRPVAMVETMGVVQKVFRRGTHYSYTCKPLSPCNATKFCHQEYLLTCEFFFVTRFSG